MFADQWAPEDPHFTREMWRISIAMNASTPGYAQWVQQTKKYLALLQEPQATTSSSPSVAEQWSVIPIEAGTPPNSQRFGLLMRD